MRELHGLKCKFKETMVARGIHITWGNWLQWGVFTCFETLFNQDSFDLGCPRTFGIGKVDVKTVFLHGQLQKQIHMIVEKTLYGLKQSPHVCNDLHVWHIQIWQKPWVWSTESQEHKGNPENKHWEATYWVFRYLKGASKVGILYSRDDGSNGRVTSL